MFLIKVESSLQLPDTHNTVAVRASLAQEYVKVNISPYEQNSANFFLKREWKYNCQIGLLTPPFKIGSVALVIHE